MKMCKTIFRRESEREEVRVSSEVTRKGITVLKKGLLPKNIPSTALGSIPENEIKTKIHGFCDSSSVDVKYLPRKSQ